MNFLSEGKRTIKADERYEDIYTKLSEKTGMNIPEIFYLCVLIGFHSKRKSDDFITGRKELRVAYFDETQRSILYAIASEFKPLPELNDTETINSVIKEYQKYSNGGMEILIENVFKDRYKKWILQDNYTKYEVDLLKYVYEKTTEVPF